MNMMEFMQACSDLETDDGKKEVQSPWPVFMKNEIWSDRVKIRNMMKKEMARFAEDLEEHGEGMVEHLCNIPANSLTRLFQLPRDELSEIIQEKYDVRGAFLVVFCAVVEQVANFPVTGYSNDGRGEEEVRIHYAPSPLLPSASSVTHLLIFSCFSSTVSSTSKRPSLTTRGAASR
jgi:hypothetical protein